MISTGESVHTSVPSFHSDVKVLRGAERRANPALKIGMIGAKVEVKSDTAPAEAPCHRLRLPQ